MNNDTSVLTAISIRQDNGQHVFPTAFLSSFYFAAKHTGDMRLFSVISAQIREKILKSKFSDKIYHPLRVEYIKKMSEVYKSVADGCVALQDRIGNYSTDKLEAYKQNKEEIYSVLAKMLGSAKIKKILEFAEFDMAEFYDMYGLEKINNVILYAKDLKDRYTVLWINYDLVGEADNQY